MLKAITPHDAATRLRAGGAVLVDVREPGEHARAHIPGAVNRPLSRLEAAGPVAQPGQAVLFHCQSGARTRGHAARLAALASGSEAFEVAGGLQAWRRAGLPVEEDAAPGPGGVRLAVGALALLGAVLAVAVSPWFIALVVVAGAGMALSGRARGAPPGASRGRVQG
jgi:rhodanese-related sulfurtransferase